MNPRAAAISLLCALATAPAAYAADGSTGGAVAPPVPAEAPAAPAPVTTPTGASAVPSPATPAPAPVVTPQPAPLAASPEAAVQAVPPAPAPAPVVRPAAAAELATIVRESPPLRPQLVLAAQGGDADDPDVVRVPVPRAKAPAAAAVPAAVASLPRTGFDVGLMASVALAMVSAGLMILAVLTPAEPALRDARRRRP